MSTLGVQVQAKIALEISVLWSVIIPWAALTDLVKTVLSTIAQLKENAMNILHAMVLFGVALSSVPGQLAKADWMTLHTHRI